MTFPRQFLILCAMLLAGASQPAPADEGNGEAQPRLPIDPSPPPSEETTLNQDERNRPIVENRNPPEEQEPALSINEPTYIVGGKNDGEARIRFQFSFKYRLFDSQWGVAKHVPSLAKLHFGYTQRSLWNISAESRPFEDSSYRPSFFWEFIKSRSGRMPDFLRFGFEHESNGQSGENSRSLNTLFAFPAWQTQLANRDLFVGIKPFVYLSQGENNSDIEDYRGYAELHVHYGNANSWLISALWQHGTEDKNAIQLDLSYPIRKEVIARNGGYFFIQTFYGYGESLLTYDQKQDVNIRLGFAFVR